MIKVAIKNTYDIADIDRYYNNMLPGAIQLPDAFLLLGMLTGMANSEKYDYFTRIYAAKTIMRLKDEWDKFNINTMADRDIGYAQQFLATLNTMVGVIHIRYGADIKKIKSMGGNGTSP